MQSLNNTLIEKNLNTAFERMKLKKYDEAKALLDKGIKEAEKKKDVVLMGVYCSAFGVLFKLKKEFRKSWKFYEQAEKCIPGDLSLKLISCRLLADYFGQYDTVIRKMEKVIETAPHDPILQHQASTLAGYAFFKKGDKKKGIEFFKKSMADGFKKLQTAANLDFKLVGELLRKKQEKELCRQYLETALKFAQSTKEKPYQQLIHQMLKKIL